MGLDEADHDASREGLAPASTGRVLRAALGAALSVGLLAGVCDAWLASSATQDAWRWAGVAAAVAIDCGALALILVPLALILQLVARGKSERSLLLFYTTLGMFIALFAGLQAWRGAGLSQGGLLGGKLLGLVLLPATAWLLVRSRPAVQLAARVVALVLIAAYCFTTLRTPAGTLAAESVATQGVVVVAVPGLAMTDLAELPELGALVAQGTLVTSVRATPSALSAWVEGLQGRDVDSWWRRFRSALVVEKLEEQLRTQRGKEHLAQRIVASQRAPSELPAWSVMRLDGEVTKGDADDLLATLMRELELAGLREETLILVIGIGVGGDFESQAESVPLLLANTRLLPHGKRISEPVELEQVLPTVAKLLGLPAEPDGEVGFEDLILGAQRGEGRE